MTEPQASAPLVRLHNLKKHFGKVQAVRDASMTIETGQIYALLGRNGAGKTTALRMLLGLSRPDNGRIELFGQELGQDRAAALARIGAMVEAPSAYPHLTARENLHVTRRLRGLDKRTVDEALEIVDLTQDANRKVKTYSLGMKGRLGLANALIGSPELILLDEPLNGLDPSGIREVRALIQTMPERGITVLLSSHQLGEVEQVATHVGILHDGISRFEGPLSELRAASKPALRLRAEPEPRARELLATMGTSLEQNPDGLWVLQEPNLSAAEINRALVQADVAVHHLEQHKASLEDLFLELTDNAEEAA
ncbi:MAG: ATP-binding cassette domain-containing protein [Planctomycetota bacterium]